MPEPIYDESTIKSLDWKEHIRTRPGMYIGKLGDGSSHDDGIYILLKEVVDNGIDEFIMGDFTPSIFHCLHLSISYGLHSKPF